MQNWVLTGCGKQVSFVDDGLMPMYWNQAQDSEEIYNLSQKLNMNQERFNARTPSVGDVEDAIVSQLPIYLIEKSDNPIYIIENANYTNSALFANCNSIQLKLPEGCWESVNVEDKYIESIGYLANSHRTGEYYNVDDEKIQLANNDVFLMTFYKEWLVFYRVYKTKENNHKLLAAVMKNSNSLCKDLQEMTYNEKTMYIEHKYRTVTSKNSNVVILGEMKIRNGWLESILVKKLPISPFKYLEELS